MGILDDKISNEAAMDEATSLAFSTAVGSKPVVKITEGALTATVGKGLAKKIPGIGLLVSAGTTAMESWKNASQGKWDLAGASVAVGVPEAAGGFLGFGFDAVAREASRGALIKLAGAKYEAVEKSDAGTLLSWWDQYVNPAPDYSLLDVAPPCKIDADAGKAITSAKSSQTTSKIAEHFLENKDRHSSILDTAVLFRDNAASAVMHAEAPTAKDPVRVVASHLENDRI